MVEIESPTPPTPGGLRGFVSAYGPGLLMSLVVAMAATFLSEQYGAPTMLMALLVGMAFHFLSVEGRCKLGIDLAARRILRIGVVLLGARISFEQIMDLGLTPLLLVVCGVVATILFGLAAARALRLERGFGLLTGGATAICGASAAMAISSVLPNYERRERDTVFAVIGVTSLSTLAMVAYPVLAPVLGLDATDSGVLIGATIHDVAQVAGAGFTISDEVGEIAIFVKLFRVALLLPLVLVLALMFRGSRQQTGASRVSLLPGFLFGFVALLILNSIGAVPAVVGNALAELSAWCLVIAVAALGMKTSIKTLADVGTAGLALIVAETLFLLVIVVVALLAS